MTPFGTNRITLLQTRAINLCLNKNLRIARNKDNIMLNKRTEVVTKCKDK